jgi:hypothetical protein
MMLGSILRTVIMLDGLVLAAYQVEAYDFPVKNQVEDRNFKRDRERWLVSD